MFCIIQMDNQYVVMVGPGIACPIKLGYTSLLTNTVSLDLIVMSENTFILLLAALTAAKDSMSYDAKDGIHQCS